MAVRSMRGDEGGGGDEGAIFSPTGIQKLTGPSIPREKVPPRAKKF